MSKDHYLSNQVARIDDNDPDVTIVSLCLNLGTLEKMVAEIKRKQRDEGSTADAVVVEVGFVKSTGQCTILN